MCSFLNEILESYDFEGSHMMLLIIGSLTIVYTLLKYYEMDVVVAKPIMKLRNFGDFRVYVKELSALLASNSKLEAKVDITKEEELVVRGYVAAHPYLCPCADECPLGAALKAKPKTLRQIDKTQYVYKSIPLLVSHIEKVFEYYLEKYARKVTVVMRRRRRGQGSALRSS